MTGGEGTKSKDFLGDNYTLPNLSSFARRTVNLQANELIRERGGSKLPAYKRAISLSAVNATPRILADVPPRSEKEKICEKISASFIKERRRGLFRIDC